MFSFFLQRETEQMYFLFIVQFTYNTHHAHIQSTSELFKELENVQHHDYLTSVLPANIGMYNIIIASELN